MSEFQSEKRLVRDYYEALDTANYAEITDVLLKFTAKDYAWRAFHPFGLKTDIEVISDTFWRPFRHSIQHLQRRMDVFFAGNNFIDDGESVWVCSMGHLMGLFDKAWIGIQPTNKIILL